MQRWAALPPATLPVAAAAAAEPDPIYAAIEACRKAQRYFEWACAKADRLGEDYDGHSDRLTSALWDTYKDFAEIVPTTTAGIVEKIVFADEARECHPDAFDEVKILSTLASAAKRLMQA